MRLISRVLLFLFIFFICIVLFGKINVKSAEQSDYNVIIINLEGLSVGDIGCCRGASPNIGNFIKEGIIFNQVATQSPWSFSSQASILTSKYVHAHGVYNKNQKLSEKEMTLGEVLKIYGYNTAAFIGSLDVVADSGLNQGFDLYRYNKGRSGIQWTKIIFNKALQWLKKNKDSKFFLYLNIEGLYPSSEFLSKDRKVDKSNSISIGRNCDEYVLLMNKFTGKLLERVEHFGLADKTMIFLISGFGRKLSNRNELNRDNLNEEFVHVPLMVRYPGCPKNKQIEEAVQLIDIMPTILDFLDIPLNKEAQGKSIISVVENVKSIGEINPYVYSESDRGKVAIRTKKWKMITWLGNYKLYNLNDDPLEINDLACQNPDIVYEFVQKLSEWYKQTKPLKPFSIDRVNITDEVRKKLMEIGYW